MSSDAEIRAKLQQASQLLSSGSKAEAKRLVDEVLQESPYDADAWFIASLVTDTLEQKFSALELALQINPQHTKSKEYLAHLQKETPTDISQKTNRQSAGDMIGKVVSEAAKLIGGWLGLPSNESPLAVSQEVILSPQESKNGISDNFGQDKSPSQISEPMEHYEEKTRIAEPKDVSKLITKSYAEKGVNMKFQGNRNDVSDATALEKGLYIISYQYKADDDFPIFNIEIENIEDEEEKIDISDSQRDSKKGTVHKGKQKARLQGGKYVVGVSVNGASSWSIEILKPE